MLVHVQWWAGVSVARFTRGPAQFQHRRLFHHAPRQKSLSAKIEAKACCHLLDPSSQEHHRRAHFCLNRIPGAGTWLFALPDSRVPHFLPHYFGSAFAVAFACPSGPRTRTARSADKSCGDHALVCGCGGRSGHSPQSGARRGSFCRQSRGQPGHCPGKAGPLDPSGPSTTIAPWIQTRSKPSSSSRRPADVWVPRGPSGGQEAWDFSTASALRLGSPLPDPSALASFFRLCRVSQELVSSVQPLSAPLSWHLVLPSCTRGSGRWVVRQPPIRGLLDRLRESKRTNPIGGPDACFKIAQRISRTLHGKRARDLEAGTRAIWRSVLVLRHVSLGRVGTVVICWSVVLVVSLPVPGSGLFWEVCFCLHQETDHGDTWTSFFQFLSRIF